MTTKTMIAVLFSSIFIVIGCTPNTESIERQSENLSEEVLPGTANSVTPTAESTEVHSLKWLNEDLPDNVTAYHFEDQLFKVSVSPQGDTLTIASSNGVYVYKVDAVTELFSRLSKRVVEDVLFSLDGDILVSGDHEGFITLWDAKNGDQINVLMGAMNKVSRLAYAPNNNVLAVGGPGGIVSWYLPDGKQTQTFDTNVNWVTGLALSPDGKLLASGTGGSTITLWNVSNGEQNQILEGDSDWGGVVDIAFSPDGNILAAAFGEGIVVLWDMVSGERIGTYTGHSWAYSIAFSSDGSVLAIGFDDTTVVLLYISTGEQLGVLQGPLDWELWGAALDIAFFPDENMLVAVYSEGIIAFWNIESALENTVKMEP